MSNSVAPIFAVPLGKIRFCGVNRVDDILRRTGSWLGALEIQVHRHDPRLAAVWPRHCRALDGGQANPDLVLANVVELLFGEFAAGDAVLEDGHGRGVVADDQRRRLARAASAAGSSAQWR